MNQQRRGCNSEGNFQSIICSPKMTSMRNDSLVIVPVDGMWGRWQDLLLPKASLRCLCVSRPTRWQPWNAGIGWGLHCPVMLGRLLRGQTQPEPLGGLFLCPGRGDGAWPWALRAWLPGNGEAWPGHHVEVWPGCHVEA